MKPTLLYTRDSFGSAETRLRVLACSCTRTRTYTTRCGSVEYNPAPYTRRSRDCVPLLTAAWRHPNLRRAVHFYRSSFSVGVSDETTACRLVPKLLATCVRSLFTFVAEICFTRFSGRLPLHALCCARRHRVRRGSVGGSRAVRILK